VKEVDFVERGRSSLSVIIDDRGLWRYQCKRSGLSKFRGDDWKYNIKRKLTKDRAFPLTSLKAVIRDHDGSAGSAKRSDH